MSVATSAAMLDFFEVLESSLVEPRSPRLFFFPGIYVMMTTSLEVRGAYFRKIQVPERRLPWLTKRKRQMHVWPPWFSRTSLHELNAAVVFPSTFSVPLQERVYAPRPAPTLYVFCSLEFQGPFDMEVTFLDSRTSSVASFNRMVVHHKSEPF